MIERIAALRQRRLDIFEMHDKPGPRVGLAVDGDTHAEGMSVHARIRMARRRRRQEMGGFEEELFIDAHGGCLGDFGCCCQGLGKAKQLVGLQA